MAEQQFLCLACGTVGKPKLVNKGSAIIEIALWLCFIAPGVVYSAWRIFNKDRYCKACRTINPIPLSSPVAQRFLEEQRARSIPPVPAAPVVSQPAVEA